MGDTTQWVTQRVTQCGGDTTGDTMPWVTQWVTQCGGDTTGDTMGDTKGDAVCG